MVGVQQVGGGTVPRDLALVYEMNEIGSLHHTVHVVRDDHRGHVEFACQIANEVVNDNRRLRVKTGVGFVAEEVFGVHGNGPCDSHALLHASTEFGRVFAACRRQFYALQTHRSALAHLFFRRFAEHAKGEHDILFHRHAVEQRAALEEHSDFLSNRFALLPIHRREISAVVGDVPFIGFQQSDRAFGQHTFA